MPVDVLNVFGSEAPSSQSPSHGQLSPQALRVGGHQAEGVVGAATGEQLGKNWCAPGGGALKGLEQEHSGPLSHHQPIPVSVKGAAALAEQSKLMKGDIGGGRELFGSSHQGPGDSALPDGHQPGPNGVVSGAGVYKTMNWTVESKGLRDGGAAGTVGLPQNKGRLRTVVTQGSPEGRRGAVKNVEKEPPWDVPGFEPCFVQGVSSRCLGHGDRAHGGGGQHFGGDVSGVMMGEVRMKKVRVGPQGGSLGEQVLEDCRDIALLWG